MSTIRFGCSVGPAGVNSEGTPHTWEEEAVPDDADPNRIVQCPYDKNHQIRASRFPFHVLKCRKNHPKLASELKTCPFNARHLIPKHELSHHVANCEDKKPLSAEGHVEILEKFQVPLNSWTNPSPNEDWETETDDSAALFVWGKANNHQPPTLNNRRLQSGHPMDYVHRGLYHGISDMSPLDETHQALVYLNASCNFPA